MAKKGGSERLQTVLGDPNQSPQFQQAIKAVELALAEIRQRKVDSVTVQAPLLVQEEPISSQPLTDDKFDSQVSQSPIEALLADDKKITYPEFEELRRRNLILIVYKDFDRDGTDLDHVTVLIVPLEKKDIVKKIPQHDASSRTTRYLYQDKQGQLHKPLVREAEGYIANRIWALYNNF